jgi:hypothetical protein
LFLIRWVGREDADGFDHLADFDDRQRPAELLS